MDWFLRRLYLRDATVGVLECGTHRFFTLEDAMKGGGLAKDSCVPSGAYDLVKHSGPKYKDTFALVGEQVSHMPEPGKARSAVLFHAGNWVRDTEGCVLLGYGWRLLPEPMVTESRKAFDAWRALMAINSGPSRLRIVGG